MDSDRQHLFQRLNLFSSTTHREDKLFSLCLTRDSNGFISTQKSIEDATWSDALIAATSRPTYKYPDSFKDIYKFLGYLQNVRIFRKFGGI